MAQLAQRPAPLATIAVKDGDTRDRNVLEQLDVGAYHNVIVLSDDQLDPLTADSRVLVTLLHLRDILAKRGHDRLDRQRDARRPGPGAGPADPADDFVVSEQLVSLLMTQISENRHLESVFTDLFDPEGAEIYIRPASYYLRRAPASPSRPSSRRPGGAARSRSATGWPSRATGTASCSTPTRTSRCRRSTA